MISIAKSISVTTVFLFSFGFLCCGKKDGSSGTTLKALAEQRGISFGSYYNYERRGDVHDQVFETEMKVMTVGAFWKGVIRKTSSFDFAETDAIVAWGRQRDMELNGHVLVWFNDIPSWVEASSTSNVESIMNEHIDTVVGRYKGQLKLWDVVNEAVDSDGTLRQGHKWAVAMGDDYIRKAFVRAYAADLTPVLRYNDYDIDSNQAKFEGVKTLLTNLKNQGAPVHALGWQMHITPSTFVASTVLARMNEIADLGFDNYITELDVALSANPSEADYELQKKAYKAVVETFLAALRHKNLVVWGIQDGDPEWIPNTYPLLFNENFQKKPAYYGVVEALQNASIRLNITAPFRGTTIANILPHLGPRPQGRPPLLFTGLFSTKQLQ